MSNEIDSKQVADMLRSLADLVEKCKVKESNFDISQFTIRKGADDNGWVIQVPTGDMSVDVQLSLYNPENDKTMEFHGGE